jgi:hypothetical protein
MRSVVTESDSLESREDLGLRDLVWNYLFRDN